MSASADDRPVKVILSAVVSDYVEKMEAARKATDETREANQKAAAEAEKVKATWKTVGTTMTAVGGAVLSVGAAMLTAGINYNAMQQQTRAALSTVLGSAQAANAQMDKLDEFAKTSPFAKTTFIKAQQQMLAFGIETQKVIPYLSAIGDATAAAGGSNQQIEEIAAIMSKISSSSKITAEDLNQFGERGINAAELIGLSMGKTAKQIREEITAGTLDADAALDALVQGMNSKFEGASANVKTTFSGALDRVSAAWRDLSSELAEPLVGANGGGMLVDALNFAADLLRGFQALPEPVKATTVAIIGTTAAVVAAKGAWILAAPKMAGFTENLRTMGLVGGGLKGTLGGITNLLGGPWGIALIAAGAALAILDTATKGSAASAEDAANAWKTLSDSTSIIEMVADNGGEGLRTLTGDTKDLGAALDSLKTSMGDGPTSIPFFNAIDELNLGDIKTDVQALGDGLATLVSEDLDGAATAFADFAEQQGLTDEQILTLIDSSSSLSEALATQATQLGLTADDTTKLQLLTGELGSSSQESAEKVAAITGAAEDASGAIDELAKDILNFGSAEIDTRESTRKFEEAVWALSDSFSANGATLSDYTAEGIANGRALDDLISRTKQLASDTYVQTGSQEAANAVLQQGRDRLYAQRDAYVAAGGSASDFDRYVRSIPESVGTDITAYANTNNAEADLNWTARDRTVNVRTFYLPGVGNVPLRANGGEITLPRYDGGGSVSGPGTSKSDSILARLSDGEHVLTAEDVAAMGGQAGVYAFRKGLHQYGRSSGSSSAVSEATGAGSGVVITGGNFGYDPDSIGRSINREARTQRRLNRT